MKQDLFSNLPEKIKIKITEDKSNSSSKKKKNLTEEEKSLIKINKEYLESKLWTWKRDKDFKFSLPPTIFHRKIVIEGDHNLQYQNQGVQYEDPNIIGQHFSQEILDQIWQKGEFTIKSTEPELPYTWKLSALSVKGIQNVKYRYRKDMSYSFYFLYSLYYRFSTHNYKNCFPLSFPSSIYHIYNTFYQLINLFFGLPLYDYSSYEIELKIKKQRLLDFIKANNDLDFLFFYQENRRKLNEFDEDFNNKWLDEIQPRLMKKYSEQKLNKDQITSNLSEDKKREFLQYLTENNQKFADFEKKHPCAKDYLLSQQSINDTDFYCGLERNQKIENYEKELAKNYIRDLCLLWHNDKMDEYREKVSKETEDEKEKKIKRDIQNKKDPSSVYYYNTNNNKEIPQIVKDEVNKRKAPYRTYEIKKYLTKPYEKYQEEINGGAIRYYLRKYKYHEVKTSFCFWRVVLFIIKYYCAFCNFNIFIYRQMTDSMLGIKALFLCELYRDYDIDNINGTVSQSKKTYTFPKSVQNLIIWVQESRNRFESTPDTGILGKGCTRIFNLFLNYVLKLFILGTLLITFYPTFIIINVIICLCSIILSPLIIALWITLDYLFCIIIYNRYDLLRFLPLIRIVLLDFIIGFLIQIIGSILSVLIQPSLSLILFVYSQMHFILRYIYDLFFYCIFKCLGKVPETDNCMAWKIGGPGLFRDRYYDIKNRDILSLVIGELEKRIMNNYKKKMIEILQGPKRAVEDIKDIYNTIGLDYKINNEIEYVINHYVYELDEIIRKRDFYPQCNVTVKFTEERIENVRNMVEYYVREYSKDKDISFELDKWEEKKIENLAENIMITIFGSHIFEPLKSSDKIVHLQSAFKNELDEITTKIFENPLYKDKIYVEERPREKKVVGNPMFATFRQIFLGNLNLDLSILNKKEKDDLIPVELLIVN